MLFCILPLVANMCLLLLLDGIGGGNVSTGTSLTRLCCFLTILQVDGSDNIAMTYFSKKVVAR